MVKRYSLDTMKALMERQNPLYGRIDPYAEPETDGLL